MSTEPRRVYDNFKRLSKAGTEKRECHHPAQRARNGNQRDSHHQNFLGGYYYLTCDEFEIQGKNIRIVEAKHKSGGKLPSNSDIKDALLKMILFTNLEYLKVGEEDYIPVPVLKLTTDAGFSLNSLSSSQSNLLSVLKQEAETNGFQVIVNETRIV